MEHTLWSKPLRAFLNFVMAGIIVLGVSGCVKISISADKNEVLPYEEVTLTATCTPEDSGGYSYLWSVIEAPLGSKYYTVPWQMLESKKNEQVFAPDIPGIYKLDGKVLTGTIEGMDIATITINCVGSSWVVEPTELDFKFIQTQLTVNVENQSAYPIDLQIDNPNNEDWITDIEFSDSVDGNTTSEITVHVSRDGLDTGHYETSFDVFSPQCGRETITVTMDVGDARILFCVDTSGSMEDNDPDNMRVNAVNDTVEKFIGNQRVSYGIIDFDDDAEMISEFVTDQDALNTAAGGLADHDGWTNYLGQGDSGPGALDEIDNMIDDLSYYYVVIFLSDGEPTLGNEDPDDIVNKVTQIASRGNIKLYTIYLNGDPLTEAEDLLGDMAVAGGTDNVLVVSDAGYLSFIDLKF